MGFFETAVATSGRRQQQLPLELLARNGCRLCPLDRAKIKSPKMEPLGSAEPLVYFLGEVPGIEADRYGEPIAGGPRRLLDSHIPREYRDAVRYSNAVQCHPEFIRKPTDVEMACCKGRVVSDIEETHPVAIVGMGGHALQWAINEARITLWRGRRFPIKVGSHTCWFYPVVHPDDILEKQATGFGSSDEFTFGLDMKRVFFEVERLPAAEVHDLREMKRGVVSLHGHEPGAFEKLKSHLQHAIKAPLSGIDYETNGQRPYRSNAKILSAAVALADETLAFGWDHPGAQWSAKDRAGLEKLWIEYLEQSGPKAVHALAFEMEWSAFMFGRDIIRKSRWEDTMTGAAVLDPRSKKSKDGPLSLGWQTRQNFGINIKHNSYVDRALLEAEPLEAVLPYNAVDAKYHRHLRAAQAKLLHRFHRDDYYEMMLRRVPTAVLTQLKGIGFDLGVSAELSEKYGAEIASLDEELADFEEVGEYERLLSRQFNPGSDDHVKELFHKVINIYIEKADEEVLKEIDHPIVKPILRRRKVSKRKSTYVDGWRDAVWPDGLIHHQLHTAFVVSGRSSADQPNTQNAIKRDEEGKEVRRQVRPREGYIYFSVDSGQIQARNIAMESRDKTFCKALWEDYDIHTEWADRIAYAYPARVGGLDEYKGDPKLRKVFRNDVKNQFVFPNFFGAQLESVAGYLHIPPEALGPEFRKFWKVFDGVKQFQEKLYKQYKDVGYVESLAGGRSYAPLSMNKQINHPIQNDEAAIVFDAFNRLSETGDEFLQANLEIHDDLLFELPSSEFDRCFHTVIDEMLRCTFDWINVPLSVEAAVGEDWLHMEEVAKFRSDKWHGTPIRAKEFM